MGNISTVIFKKYFANDFVVKSDISSDNKKVSIASIDYSKLIVSTNIEIISVADAVKKPETSVIKNYTFDKVLVNLAFKSSDTILAQFSDEIYLVDTKEKKKVFETSNYIKFVKKLFIFNLSERLLLISI